MSLKIVLTGGGSGGHITPILAVAAELRRRQPQAQLIYIGQKGDGLADIPAADPNIDAVYAVRAGKFRRYHGEGLRQLLDVKTLFLNVRDAFYVVIGIWQSRRLIKRLQPDIIFSRGGFVTVPVALGGVLNHVPYITHDSDSIPSLANRLIARWAAVHAVALPKDNYPYPQAKTVTTGIPLQHDFKPVTVAAKKHYRQEIGVPADAKLIFIIGGGLGSRGVNQAVSEALPHLLAEFKDLHAVHVVGRANEAEMQALYQERLSPAKQGRVQVYGYMTDVYRYSGAADIVVTRGGATNLAEFAVQGKACVVIPSSFLAGGHQLENARYLAEAGAAVVIGEAELTADSNRLAKLVSQLLNEPTRQQSLAEHLAGFAKPNATEELADLIMDQAQKGTPVA
jgi:UDP-N-acetylglucosamine--N-acetylmuramyl-(pentapeptide) pyrophosphoryl-undecaprenol N-acetylglucosamine transferase